MIKNRKFLPTLLAIVMLIADQLSKLAIYNWLPLYSKVTIIPYIIDFTYIGNEGAAFGLFKGMPWLFMTVTTVVIIVALFIFFTKKIDSKILLFAIMLIVSGGIGNMIDRVFRGFVIDFINFTFINFYVFNIADSCVVIGCTLFIIYLVIDTIKEARLKKNGEQSE